jgi:hypothetical protein
MADKIRDEMNELGVDVKDRAVTWRTANGRRGIVKGNPIAELPELDGRNDKKPTAELTGDNHSTFCRAHEAVELCLMGCGWANEGIKVEKPTDASPTFIFRNPSFRCKPLLMQFESEKHFRQLPDANTHCLDDKHELFMNIAATGDTSYLPTTYPDVSKELLETLADADADEVATTKVQPHWFLKHRLDAKRPRVHPFSTVAKLREFLEKKVGHEKGWKWYVLQREVWPPMLLHKRKFILRAHVLVSGVTAKKRRGAHAVAAQVAGNTKGDSGGGGEGLRVYLHSAPIMLENDQPYDLDQQVILTLQHSQYSQYSHCNTHTAILAILTPQHSHRNSHTAILTPQYSQYSHRNTRNTHTAILTPQYSHYNAHYSLT